MKTIANIAIVVFAVSWMALAQQDVDLVITKPNSSVLRIEFRPQIIMQQVHGSGGEIFMIPIFRDAILPDGKAGTAMVPVRAIPLDLRGKGYSVQVLEVSSREIHDVALAPHPTYRSDRTWGANTEFIQGTELGGVQIPALAQIVSVGPVPGGLQGTLQLTPIQFNPATRTLKIYDRMVVQVTLGAPPGTLPRRKEIRSDSPLKTGAWYSMEVRENGIYKLDQSFFTKANIPLSSISNIHSIRIFGNGGQMLPENLLTARPDGLQEIPRLVMDVNGNGVFDSEDYLVFFGKSPRGWTYDPIARTYRHFINYYTEVNRYFVTFGGPQGRSMDSVSSIVDPTPIVPPDFQGRLFVEEERNNLANSGRQWYGQLFDSESKTGVYTNLLPGYVETKPTTYRFVLLSRSPSSESFLVQENGADLGPAIGTSGVDVSSIEGPIASITPIVTYTRTGPLPGNRSVLRFTFQVTDASAQGWLDWFDILYRRRFEAVDDFLSFPSPDTSGVVEYDLSQFSSRNVLVFDVTDHANVVRISGLSFDAQDPSQCSFQLPQSPGSVREFMAVGANGFRTPGALRPVENSNLHGITTGAQFVIVTPRAFRSGAERLKQYRETHDSLSCIIVNEEDIVNEYSGGLTDPIAVRDFLKDAQLRWTIPPRYVLLFGSGHFDYKNIQTQSPDYIPPFESLESINQIGTYASDDLLAMLNPGNPRVSVALGRLPAKSLDDANNLVDKIIGYESSAPYDPWRNRITFVADDGLTSTQDDGSEHTDEAEILAQAYTPASFEKKKIYIVEFPTVNSSSGRRKPTANTAIVDAMNAGSLIVNYTGHGNPQLWAHEAVFTREANLPQLVNKDRLFFLVAATCDFARYDNPAEESAGEQLLTMTSGGAIGVVTSSRAVYSADNSLFNNTLYGQIFLRDSTQRPVRLGDAMFQTKQARFSSNDIKFHLFADPTMRLNIPAGVAGVDSINGSFIAGITQIKALSRTEVAGEIRTPNGAQWNSFNGKGVLEVFDAQRQVSIQEGRGVFSFVVNGSLLYRGQVSVTDGMFQATVPIPKDVSYSSDNARISLYAWTGSTDAVGFTQSVVIAGTDSSASSDTTGPRIDIYVDDEGFHSGDVVRTDPLLIIKLFDQSGINTSTASVGHRLEATLSRSQQAIDLTDSYQGDVDTYQQGEARYQLRGLPNGRQMLSVKAWDIYNNSSEAQVEIDVRQESDLAMYQVFNFPNPVSRSTVFTFQRNSSEPIDVTVKIYTVAGRKVGEIQVPSIVDRFVQIPWDGRDANGDTLANGVYFYKIVVHSPTGGGSQEVIGKLTMLR